MGFFESLFNGLGDGVKDGSSITYRKDENSYYVVCPVCDKKITVIGERGEVKCSSCGKIIRYS